MARRSPRLLLSIISGAIGKSFVVKHCKGRKIVVTRLPDMSGIVASEQQRVRRDLFREAVVYAKWILADAERKKAFRKSLPGRKQRKVYQAAIQLYMSKQGDKQWLRKQLAVKGMMRAQVSDRPWTPDKQKEAISNRQGTERTVVKVQELVKTGMQVEGIVTYRQGAMSNGQGTIGNGQELMGRMGQQQGTISNKQRCINTEWSMVKMRGRNGKWSINDYEQQGSWRAVWEKRELVKVVRKEQQGILRDKLILFIKSKYG